MRRRALAAIALGAAICAALFFGSATAHAGTLTISGSDYAHQQTVRNVANEYPWVLAKIRPLKVGLPTWGYGTGKTLDMGDGTLQIWVDGTWSNPKFSDVVAHEFGHALWLSVPAMQQGWYDELTRRGYPPSTWSDSSYIPACYSNPREAFAENFKRALFSPYYTTTTTPNTVLAWLSRADMKAFLARYGVRP
jgi:hypothetical protein